MSIFNKLAGVVLFVCLFATSAAADGVYSRKSIFVGGIDGIFNKSGSAAPSFTGACDVASASCGLFYGLRAANGSIASAGTQPLVNLRNTSTQETCDVLPKTTGSPGNTASCSGASSGTPFATFCAAGCAVAKVYNQIVATTCGGSNCDLTQTTTANQPLLTLNCVGTSPCISDTGNNGVGFTSPNSFSILSTVTMSGVWNYSANASSTQFFNPSNGTSVTLTASGTANTLVFSGFFTNFNFIANTGTWHSINAASLNSTSSFAQTDGVATTGSINGNAGSNVMLAFIGTTGVNLKGTEWLLSNTSWSQAIGTAVCKNQQAYYGAGNFGAAC